VDQNNMFGLRSPWDMGKQYIICLKKIIWTILYNQNKLTLFQCFEIFGQFRGGCDPSGAGDN